MSRLRTVWTRVVVAAAVPVLLLSACDGGPSGLDGEDVSPEVAQTVLQSWSQLPAEEGMDLQLRDALPTGGEGAWGLQWSSVLAGEGEDARAGGDPGPHSSWRRGAG